MNEITCTHPQSERFGCDQDPVGLVGYISRLDDSNPMKDIVDYIRESVGSFADKGLGSDYSKKMQDITEMDSIVGIWEARVDISCTEYIVSSMSPLTVDEIQGVKPNGLAIQIVDPSKNPNIFLVKKQMDLNCRLDMIDKLGQYEQKFHEEDLPDGIMENEEKFHTAPFYGLTTRAYEFNSLLGSRDTQRFMHEAFEVAYKGLIQKLKTGSKPETKALFYQMKF